MWVTLLLALLCLPVWLAARLGLASAAAIRQIPGRRRWVVWAAGSVGDLDPSLHRLYIHFV